MQLHGAVFELDEPMIVKPTSLEGWPSLFRRLEEYLGFQYITLRCFNFAPGSLDAVESLIPANEEREPMAAAVAG